MAQVHNKNREEKLAASDVLGLRSATLQKQFQKKTTSLPLSWNGSQFFFFHAVYYPSDSSNKYTAVYRLYILHDKLVHSFHNRQICPLEGFIVSAHRLSCPARFPTPLPLVQTQASTPLKTPPSPHRRSGCTTYRIHNIKLMHFLPQLAVRFCPPQKRFFLVSAHRLQTSPC